MNTRPLKYLIAIVLTIICTACVHAQTDTAALRARRQSFRDNLPKPVSWTNDMERIFTDRQKQQLDSVAHDFEQKNIVQFCIVTLDTMSASREQFNELALYISKAWGVGQKDKNNGITICISAGYRMVKICNGYGIAAVMSDGETKEIMDRVMIPAFKTGDYAGGIMAGMTELAAVAVKKTK